MSIEETLSRLDCLEDALLAHVQEVRAIRGEIKKQTAGGDLEPLLDAEEVAKILGVDVGHVYQQARNHKLPSIMVGKYRKFPPAELKKWIEGKNKA